MLLCELPEIQVRKAQLGGGKSLGSLEYSCVCKLITACVHEGSRSGNEGDIEEIYM